MNIQHEKRRCLSFHGLRISESDASQKSDNFDQRVVGGEQSTNVSASGGSVVKIKTTDHGAVKGAFELGSLALSTNAKLASDLSGQGVSMFEGALGAVSKANENLALAYQSGNAGEQTQLKYAGFIVVGLGLLVLAPRLAGGK